MQFIQIPQKLIWEKAFLSLRKRIDEHIKEKKRIALFLSGGSVVNLYGQLSKWIEGVAGNAITFAQVDERFQPNNREQVTYNIEQRRENINAEVMGATGLWTACEKKEIPYYCVSQEGSLKKSSQEYNQIVERLFHEYDYKIAILGIGQDGHTAGLLPRYQKKWDVDSYVVGYESTGKFPKRITLTQNTLRKLDYALVVAVGEEKRKVVTSVMLNSPACRRGRFQHLNKIPNSIRRIQDPEYIEGQVRDDNQSNINNLPAIILHRIKKVDLYSDQKT